MSPLPPPPPPSHSPRTAGTHPQQQRGVAQDKLLHIAGWQRQPQADQPLRNQSWRLQQRRQQRRLQRRHSTACRPNRAQPCYVTTPWRFVSVTVPGY